MSRVLESPTCWGRNANIPNKFGIPRCSPCKLPETQRFLAAQPSAELDPPAMEASSMVWANSMDQSFVLWNIARVSPATSAPSAQNAI